MNSKEDSLENKTRRKNTSWSLFEDTRLIEGIKLYGTKNWESIFEYVGNNRTKSQCKQRWNRDLNPSIKREKWNFEEEKKLFQLVQLYGTKSWVQVSKLLENRTDSQCRFHYYSKIIQNKKIDTHIKKIDLIFGKIEQNINDLFEEGLTINFEINN